MKRRHFLAGTCAAIGGLGQVALLPPAFASLNGIGRSAEPPSAALLAIDLEPLPTGMHLSQIALERFWPNQSGSRRALGRWTLDLVQDADASPRHVHAWQLQRRGAGCCSPAAGFRMHFPGDARVSLQLVGQTMEGKALSEWRAPLVNAGSMLLVSAEIDSGYPPRLADLHFDSVTGELTRVDGAPRNFDAMLLRAA